MKKVEILQIGSYPVWDEEQLNSLFEVHRFFEAGDKRAFVERYCGSVRGIATRGEVELDRTLIESLPSLEIIAVYGVGYDGVDVTAAKERGIRVTNTPDVLSRDVADLGVAMMLALSRDIVGADSWIRSGSWQSRGPYPLSSAISGKTAGVLGLGRIGTELAKRLEAFDMQILYSARGPKMISSEWEFVGNVVELARRSDVLFVVVPGLPENRHIVNNLVISALGPEGILINISRAANVDEDALLDALEAGTLGSAGLDVFEGEPAVNPRFRSLTNVLLHPHGGSGTIETRKAMGRLLRENLVAQFEGRPLPTPVA